MTLSVGEFLRRFRYTCSPAALVRIPISAFWLTADALDYCHSVLTYTLGARIEPRPSTSSTPASRSYLLDLPHML